MLAFLAAAVTARMMCLYVDSSRGSCVFRRANEGVAKLVWVYDDAEIFEAIVVVFASKV